MPQSHFLLTTVKLSAAWGSNPISEACVWCLGHHAAAVVASAPCGSSQGHPPPVSIEKYNAHVFRPDGRGRANQGNPTTQRGHFGRRTVAGGPLCGEIDGRRWPEAAGGGRRRPEATEGEARVKSRPFLFRSKEKRKSAPSQNNHDNPGQRRRSWRWLACRRRRQ